MYGGAEEEAVEGGLGGGEQLRAQLRCVFDACDFNGSGVITLQDLANISRSHVDGNNQVEQILDIFECGPGGAEERLDFVQFYGRVVAFLGGEGAEAEAGPALLLSPASQPPPMEQGEFNENLRRSFEKATSSPVAKSPSKRPTRNTRRKSQARLSGRIPLVNTSSEEEEEGDGMDDSFDRKIAASLEAAQPQFLRGSSSHGRHTVRAARGPAQPAAPQRRASLSERRPPSTSTLTGGSPGRRAATLGSPRRGHWASPIPARPSSAALGSSSPLSSTPGASSGRESPQERGRLPGLQQLLGSIERTVEQLQETAVGRGQEDGYDSPSSGVGSLKVDLEDELAASVQVARRHGAERLEAERTRHREQLAGLEREHEMERRNAVLRMQELQEERDGRRREVEALQEKVRLIYDEKERSEERVAELLEERRCRSPATAVGEREEERRRADREQELLGTVQALSLRVATQDEELAQGKEDTTVLRSQVKGLREEAAAARGKEGRFRIFSGLVTGQAVDRARQDRWEDPQDLRIQLREARAELQDQREANSQLREYMGGVLGNIINLNPGVLERH